MVLAAMKRCAAFEAAACGGVSSVATIPAHHARTPAQKSGQVPRIYRPMLYERGESERHDAAAWLACRGAVVRAAAAHLGNSSCCFGGDGRLPDADPIAEGFLSASSLRLDPTKPLCWHLDGEHVPRQASRMCVVGAAAARRQR